VQMPPLIRGIMISDDKNTVRSLSVFGLTARYFFGVYSTTCVKP
jgi:hypothetical protein